MILQAAFSVGHEFSPQSDLPIRPPLLSLPSVCLGLRLAQRTVVGGGKRKALPTPT